MYILGDGFQLKNSIKFHLGRIVAIRRGIKIVDEVLADPLKEIERMCFDGHQKEIKCPFACSIVVK